MNPRPGTRLQVIDASPFKRGDKTVRPTFGAGDEVIVRAVQGGGATVTLEGHALNWKLTRFREIGR